MQIKFECIMLLCLNKKVNYKKKILLEGGGGAEKKTFLNVCIAFMHFLY